MRNKLIFLAQALDNTTPDHIEDCGEILLHSANTVLKRQDCVSYISNIALNGKQFFNKDGVKLIVYNNKSFVLEIPTVERDILGRATSIVCSGTLGTPIDEFCEDLTQKCKQFTQQIGRSLASIHLNLIRDAFDVQTKKTSFMSILNACISSIIQFIKKIKLFLWKK